MIDINTLLISLTSALGALVLILRGLLILAKFTKTTKDDKILGAVYNKITKMLELISGLKHNDRVNIEIK